MDLQHTDGNAVRPVPGLADLSLVARWSGGVFTNAAEPWAYRCSTSLAHPGRSWVRDQPARAVRGRK